MNATIIVHPSAKVNLTPVDRPGPVADRIEQLRRIAAIDLVGYVCTEYGIGTVRSWIRQPAIASPAAKDEGLTQLVEEYGPETVSRWVNYFEHQERGL